MVAEPTRDSFTEDTRAWDANEIGYTKSDPIYQERYQEAFRSIQNFQESME